MNKKPQTFLGKFKQTEGYKKHRAEAQLEMELAFLIAETRHTKSLTQKALAKLASSNQAVISRIESGQANLTLKKLMEIAKALGKRVAISFY